jgi:hypothetical protein
MRLSFTTNYIQYNDTQNNDSQHLLERAASTDATGNTNLRGSLSTVDLLIKVTHFVKKANNVSNIKNS